MTYALIVNGAVAQYPYSFAALRRDNKQVSFPRDWDEGLMQAFGVYHVQPVAQPAHDPITETVVEAEPVAVSGRWTQAWSVEEATAEQIAERQREARDAATSDEVKADAFIAAFVAMTPAELSSYIDANATTVATMRALVKKMALMLLVLARRELL